MTTKKKTAAEVKPARRAWLESGGAVATSVLLGGLAAGLAACGDDDTSPSGGTGGASGKGGAGGAGKGGSSAGKGGNGEDAGAADADIEPLNGLLKAEYSAVTAYSAGADLIGKATDKDPLFTLKDVIAGIAVDFQAQHKLHAEALVDAIKSLDGKPVVESDVAADFKPPAELVANPTITNVLKFAAGAERGAAVAYNQVLSGLESAKFRFLASSIEGDESQHFIVLASLILGLAAPTDKLNVDKAGDVVPEAFVSTVGTHNGLDKTPPDYFG
jgi:ferritin-like protein